MSPMPILNTSPSPESILASISAASGDGILAFDTECRYTLWNAGMEQISGLPAERVVGRVAFEVFPFLVETGEDACFAAALSGRVVEVENRPYHVPSASRQGLFSARYVPVYGEMGEVIGGLATIRDETERFHAEARLRAVFDALTDPILVADQVGTIVEANFAARQYLSGADLPTTSASLDAYLHSSRMFERSGRQVPDEERPIVRALAGEVVRSQEVRIEHSNGESIWALVNSAPILTQTGQIAGSVLAVHPINELIEARDQLEAALGAAEDQRNILERLFDNIPYTHIALFDADFNLVRINPEGPRLLGYDTPEEFRAALQRPGEWVCLTADGAEVPPEQWPLARALRGERFGAEEFYVVNPDGVKCRFLMNGAPIAWDSSGRVTLAVNVGQDISGLRDLVTAAQNEKARYQTLTESIPQIVWSADTRGQMVFFNSRWQETTGTPPERALGLGWLADLHPNDLDSTREGWLACCQSGAVYDAEFRLRRAQGGYGNFLARGMPVRDAAGAVVQFVGAYTDVTRQVQARERQRLLAQIGHNLRLEPEPLRLLKSVAEATGPQLDAARVFYCIVRHGSRAMEVLSEYRETEALPSMVGIHALDWPDDQLEWLAVGKTISAADIACDPRGSEAWRELANLQIRSLLAVPVYQSDNSVALLAAADSAPRAWSADELELLENIAERTRLAVENAQLLAAEQQTSARLTEAYAETHHRVKNNLQVIAALLDVRAMDAQEGRAVTGEDLIRLTGQVRAIAAVHDFLSHSHAAMTVWSRELLRRLVPMATVAAGVQGVWDCQDVKLTVKQGTALALSVNELVSNCGKHGASRARVWLGVQGENVVLEVTDDGPGFPEGFDPDRNCNQGMELLLSLARRDLLGTAEFATVDGGGRVTIRFPIAAL